MLVLHGCQSLHQKSVETSDGVDAHLNHLIDAGCIQTASSRLSRHRHQWLRSRFLHAGSDEEGGEGARLLLQSDVDDVRRPDLRHRRDERSTLQIEFPGDSSLWQIDGHLVLVGRSSHQLDDLRVIKTKTNRNGGSIDDGPTVLQNDDIDVETPEVRRRQRQFGQIGDDALVVVGEVQRVRQLLGVLVAKPTDELRGCIGGAIDAEDESL
ncbi:hypothetical protein PMAYCL1PPCAC_03393, partial [Pristionchus mayeri]